MLETDPWAEFLSESLLKFGIMSFFILLVSFWRLPRAANKLSRAFFTFLACSIYLFNWSIWSLSDIDRGLASPLEPDPSYPPTSKP